jgi:hypothetical protein
MPFDPKLIHPDEPPLAAGGELDLPADLAALGEQLSADAAHLAANYPVGRNLASPSIRHQARPRPVWHYARYAAALLVVGITLAIAAVAWQPGEPPVARTAPAIAPLPRPAVNSPVAATAPRRTESVPLIELSGPELEALLDMLADESARDTSISF